MVLQRHRDLACWMRLEHEGVQLANPAQTVSADLQQLHIGFLNMMPDRALKATERQFVRLLAAGATDYSVTIHPFTIAGLPRGVEAAGYVAKAYGSFEEIQKHRLDGLVLTGANPGNWEITAEQFWPYLEEVVHWADASVPTILCSCLASHAILKIFHNIDRMRCRPDKRWGVYSHRVVQHRHPLMTDMPERYQEPRSHVFEMTARQLEPKGIQILATSQAADFGLAVSADGHQWVFLQGHPEYDTVSLLKEFKREVNRYRNHERTDYPNFPLNYLPASAQRKLRKFGSDFVRALERSEDLPEFPEMAILPQLVNTWSHHAKVLFRNWMDLVAEQKLCIKAGQGNVKSW